MPNLESVADPVLNPGVDTDGQPVLVRVDDFRKWLTSVQHEVNPFRSGAPGKPMTIEPMPVARLRPYSGNARNPGRRPVAVKLHPQPIDLVK